MMFAGVTHQQNAALKFIERYSIEHDGTPPSYHEIASAIGLKSKSGVLRIVNGLEARGLIRRRDHQARSIVVLKPSVDRPGFSLPSDLVTRLNRYCASHDENAAAVVIDAVTLHLDSIETNHLRRVPS